MSGEDREDNVISIGTRRPYREELKEERKRRRSEGQKRRRAKSEAEREHRDCLLEMLEEARCLVEAGKLEGLMILGRDPATKHFYTDLSLDHRVISLQDTFSYIGAMEALKMELTSDAQMAPQLQADGSIIDPWDQVEMKLDEEFEE